MYSIRKVKTQSGSTAIQVVRYLGHKIIVYKHLGSAKDDEELATLRQSAMRWIDEMRPNCPCSLSRNKRYWWLKEASASE